MNLSETMGNETCFVFVDTAVCFALDAKNPLGPYNILVVWSLNGVPCACLFQCGHFAIHGFFPLGPV